MIPTPTEIKYFIEIYQTRHISKAAIRLGVTQPTLTQSLKSLESKLDVPLFFRTKQGVVPTSEAALLYAQANVLTDCWNTLKDTVTSSRQEIAGRFTVGCHASVASYTIPGLLQRISAHAPKLEIQLRHDFSRKIMEGVVSYAIDLGFVVNPPKHPELVMKKLGNDRVIFWKRPGLATIPKRLIADGTRDQVESLLGRTYDRYFSGWQLVSSTSLELIRTLTHHGLGVGILPERVAIAEGAKLIPYDEELPSKKDEIYLVYRKEVLSSNAGRELLKLANVNL